MRRFAPIFCLVLLATWLLIPATAPAQSDPNGVTVDPNSPSGTEYDIPVERARREAQGASSKHDVSPGNRSAPLFGAGVKSKTPPKSGSSGASGSGSKAAPPSGGRPSARGSTDGKSNANDTSDRESAAQPSTSGATTTSGATPAPPIGTTRASHKAGGRSKRRAHHSADRKKRAKSVAAAATVSPADVAAAGQVRNAVAEADTSGGGSGTTLAISGAGIVLLLGGLAGWLLRRRPT